MADSAQSLAGMAAASERLSSSGPVAVDQVSMAAIEMSAAMHEVESRYAARRADVPSREGAQLVGCFRV